MNIFKEKSTRRTRKIPEDLVLKLEVEVIITLATLFFNGDYMSENPSKFDSKEFELPETVFSRDIESRVIQVIILQCLGKIEGVGLIGGTLIDTLLGRDVERVKGIFVDQDSKNYLVKVKVEINVDYGVSIPEKAEEVQTKVVEEITRLTGLHVASVHVVVRGLIPEKVQEKKEPEKVYPASLLNEEEAEFTVS